MSVVRDRQMRLGEIGIAQIQFNLRSRDDIPRVLRGLQHIKCPDHGIDGFKRYVALAIVTRNIHRMGDILWQQDLEREHKANAQLSRYRRRPEKLSFSM